jgi:hypothetical protein
VDELPELGKIDDRLLFPVEFVPGHPDEGLFMEIFSKAGHFCIETGPELRQTGHFPVNVDRAPVRDDDAGEDLKKRGFPRTVFAR